MNLIYPIPNARVTGKFGETGGPYGNQPHRGMDFSAVIGTPVRAAHDGLVTNAEGEREGLCVWLRNYTTTTLYAHLSKQTKAPGVRVQAGEVIGLSGNSGYSTGPHLHFGLRVAAQYVDPEPYLCPLPEDEPATDVATLAEKCRFWAEEIIRCHEAGILGWATVLEYSLVRLLYRLEAVAKAART